MANRKTQKPGIVRLPCREQIQKPKSGKTTISIKSKEDVRCKTIAVRVSPAQEKRLNELANECGMSRSSYMLARAYNYKPKVRLTVEDKRLLETLVGVRTDVQNYSNAMQALSRDERIQLFHDYSFMLKWLRSLYQMKEHITSVLNKMFASNHVPEGIETNCTEDCDNIETET